MESCYQSKAFQEQAEAHRAGDYARRARIIAEAIATTMGTQQAFWKTLQYEIRLNPYRYPWEFREEWPALEDILLTAPDHPDTVLFALTGACRLYAMTERYQEIPSLWKLCRPIRRQLINDFHVGSFFTEMYMRKRRWHSARRACNAHLASYYRLPEARRTNMFGYLHYVFAKRALIHVILGRYQEAEADIAESWAVAAQRPPNWFSPLYLALAEAALACARGEYQVARAKLQSTVRSPERKPHFVQEEIQVLLMAARIARAEGNSASFEHFCGQAAALCQEHDLTISARAVEAVRNGAEY